MTERTERIKAAITYVCMTIMKMARIRPQNDHQMSVHGVEINTAPQQASSTRPFRSQAC